MDSDGNSRFPRLICARRELYCAYRILDINKPLFFISFVQALCGEAVGWGRRKRESDIDEIIENVTCGTTLKVKTPLIQTQGQNGK